MIIWLSSYPKSGNTLVRSLLSAYLFTKDGKFNFESLKNISLFPDITFFEKLGVNVESDDEVLKNPEEFFNQVIEINLDELEPHIVGPHTPDLARPISGLKKDANDNEYPVKISSALIGSCTNSSYEDIGRAAFIAREAAKYGLKAKVPLMVTPGSEQTRATIERDGYLKDLESIGATVLANACGPCIVQW